jgi:hypothetical protein
MSSKDKQKSPWWHLEIFTFFAQWLGGDKDRITKSRDTITNGSVFCMEYPPTPLQPTHVPRKTTWRPWQERIKPQRSCPCHNGPQTFLQLQGWQQNKRPLTGWNIRKEWVWVASMHTWKVTLNKTSEPTVTGGIGAGAGAGQLWPSQLWEGWHVLPLFTFHLLEIPVFKLY